MNDAHLFAAARECAQQADYTGGNHTKIGCVIVYKGSILAKGCNSDKTHPAQSHYNKWRYKDPGNSYLPPKIHSEIAAMQKIRYLDIDFSRVHLYVYRQLKNGERALARPCPSCMAAIKAMGIRNIHLLQFSRAHDIIKSIIKRVKMFYFTEVTP